MSKKFSDVEVGESFTFAFKDELKAIKTAEKDERGYHYVFCIDSAEWSENGIHPMILVMDDRKTKHLSEVKVGGLFVFDISGKEAIKLAETDTTGCHYVWYTEDGMRSLTGMYHTNLVKVQTESKSEELTFFGGIECGGVFKFTKDDGVAVKLSEKDTRNGCYYVLFIDTGGRSVSGISPSEQVERIDPPLTHIVDCKIPTQLLWSRQSKITNREPYP